MGAQPRAGGMDSRGLVLSSFAPFLHGEKKCCLAHKFPRLLEHLLTVGGFWGWKIELPCFKSVSPGGFIILLWLAPYL